MQEIFLKVFLRAIYTLGLSFLLHKLGVPVTALTLGAALWKGPWKRMGLDALVPSTRCHRCAELLLWVC